MSDVYDIKILVEAQLEELQKTTEAVSKMADTMNSEASGIGKVWSGVLLDVGAKINNLATKIPSAFAQTIRAFGEQEAAVQRLSTAIRANGGSVSEVLPIMQQLASDIQKITTYGDEQVLQMQAMASAMGVNAEQMQKCIEGAIGLSNVYGLGLNEAVKASASVIQGKSEKLNELIPTLSQCATAEECLALALKAMSDGFAIAQSDSETLNGKLQQAANAWSDLQEVIGGTFAPTVKSVAGLLQGLCEFLSENDILTKALTGSLASLAVGFAFTKVGGLANVAQMIAGVSGAMKGATSATLAFNAAIKSNPIGLIATAATAAVLGLGQLIESLTAETEAEKKEREALYARIEASKKVRIEYEKAEAALAEHKKSLLSNGEAAAQTAVQIKKLQEEIAKLEEIDQFQFAEDVEDWTAKTNTLIAKKKELAEAEKRYLELLKKEAEILQQTTDSEYLADILHNSQQIYKIEQDILDAREKGLSEGVESGKQSLEDLNYHAQSLELQKKYYADHAHLVDSEGSRLKLKEKAAAYAVRMIEHKRTEAETEKLLNNISESSKNTQRDLEFKILQARAQGNEALAKEHEGELRIAQLTSEIFENTRKEGMSAAELETLHQKAIQDAQNRYGLEKSIADEKERQTLATDAQAKAEDILLANKIEQLKAEGNHEAAKTLEEEREIKRTLAGMKGVSEDDKKKLANVMRQTNDYRDKQEEKRSQGGSAGGSRGSFDSDVSSAISRKNSMRSGGSSGGILSSSRNNREKGRPATVSDKYAEKYAEFQAAKKNGTLGKDKFGKTMGWNDFRDSKVDTKKQARANAKGILDGAEKTAKGIGSRVKLAGDTAEAAKSTEQTPRKASKPTPPEKPKQAASSALNNKLEQMNASPKKDGNNKENSTETILKEIKTALNSIDQNVKSLGTKKDKNA